MASNKKDIGKLLRKYGYAMPKNSDEITSFEKKFGDNFTVPNKWPKIEAIISEEKAVYKIIPIKKTENKAMRNLAMAARDGKKISKKDREQMDKDKKNARKK
ncbi:hypothetical protein [Aureibaculum conchae]|uniref:hypothetical protein n=1 Tax=Aureibaculum sp. 2308TA14-22 TaxID=3108392 RepID=UPI003395780F